MNFTLYQDPGAEAQSFSPLPRLLLSLS